MKYGFPSDRQVVGALGIAAVAVVAVIFFNRSHVRYVPVLADGPDVVLRDHPELLSDEHNRQFVEIANEYGFNARLSRDGSAMIPRSLRGDREMVRNLTTKTEYALRKRGSASTEAPKGEP